MVRDREGPVWPTHRTPCRAKACKGLGRGHLVDQVQVNIEDGLAVGIFRHPVRIPDLVIEGFAGHPRDLGDFCRYCQSHEGFGGGLCGQARPRAITACQSTQSGSIFNFGMGPAQKQKEPRGLNP